MSTKDLLEQILKREITPLANQIVANLPVGQSNSICFAALTEALIRVVQSDKPKLNDKEALRLIVKLYAESLNLNDYTDKADRYFGDDDGEDN